MKISSKPPEKVVKPIPTSPRKKMVSEKKVVKKVEAEKQVPVDVEKKQPQADKKPQAKKVLFCFVSKEVYFNYNIKLQNYLKIKNLSII